MSATPDFDALSLSIKAWGQELGFQQLGISGVELPEDERRLLDWLEAGRHGDMTYMEQHGTRRSRPPELVPGTIRVISARMDYWPGAAEDPEALLEERDRAYIARYALGRDYHKVLRARLQKLADRIQQEIGA